MACSIAGRLKYLGHIAYFKISSLKDTPLFLNSSNTEILKVFFLNEHKFNKQS